MLFYFFQNIGQNMAQMLAQDLTRFFFICWLPMKVIQLILKTLIVIQ